MREETLVRICHYETERMPPVTIVTVPPRRCTTCNDAVYFAEAVDQAGTVWHKRCFRCQTCSTTLNSKNFAAHLGKEGTELFCRPCHAKAYGTGGYGQGVSVLQAGSGAAGQ